MYSGCSRRRTSHRESTRLSGSAVWNIKAGGNGTAAILPDIIALSDAIDGSGAPVNFWGMSYGTLLGSWLINSRVILDSVADPVAVSQGETALAGDYTHRCNPTY
ncbi:hypothetical protein BD413DRAFT_557118 [Trametes elegans]|nr:hypothetical protein BD413DRAFT_557118 [Trametes elegans]